MVDMGWLLTACPHLVQAAHVLVCYNGAGPTHTLAAAWEAGENAGVCMCVGMDVGGCAHVLRLKGTCPGCPITQMTCGFRACLPRHIRGHTTAVLHLP